MTVDYTQPHQYTPPQPQPQAQKSSGCLKVLLIGCSVIIVLGLAAIAVVVFFVFGLIKGRYTGARPLKSALQTTITGGLAATAAFLIAKAIT